MSFSAALEAVSPLPRAQVEAQIGVWRCGADGWVQVAGNVERETALPIADFTSLLEAFGRELAAGTTAGEAWVRACREHQFRGALMPAASRPGVLGRAMAVATYADLVASPPLHRPTVAEAGAFAYYCPWHDPRHPHGYTAPLPPNPRGLAAQPEVVHPQIAGAGLLVPYHLTTPS